MHPSDYDGNLAIGVGNGKVWHLTPVDAYSGPLCGINPPQFRICDAPDEFTRVNFRADNYVCPQCLKIEENDG